MNVHARTTGGHTLGGRVSGSGHVGYLATARMIGETGLLLAQAAIPAQEERIGDQTGGRVCLFLHTGDFWRDYRRMREAGVSFRQPPRLEPYGWVAVFEDLYGNRWDLLQPG